MPLCSQVTLMPKILFIIRFYLTEQLINSFQPIAAFHIKTSYLIYNANQVAGFYM